MVVVETVDVVVVDPPQRPSLGWGWVLGSGLVWMTVALLILTAHPVAITSIAWIVGLVILLGAAAELINVALSPGWKWLHAVIGIGLLVLGALAFLNPFQTFVGLSILLGWYLVLKGITLMAASLVFRQPGTLWGVVLVAGLVDLLIGLWALSYPGNATWLLVLWLGFSALVHGVVDLVRAFELRSEERAA